MKDRCCGNCMFWEPTEVYIVPAHGPITSAARDHTGHSQLCTWDGDEGFVAAMLKAPTWMTKRIMGGDLTHEDDGENCPAWRHVR